MTTSTLPAAMNTTSSPVSLPGLRPRLNAALLTAALACGAAQAQTFELQPGATVLAGQPLRIVLTGVPPDTDITLHTTRLVPEFTGGQRPYTAQARFRTDAQGRVDLAAQAPLSGSYSGADVRGLFWSMTPEPGAAAPATPQQVRLQARGAGGAVLAEQVLQFQPSDPAVQRRPAAPFEGAVFASLPGAAKRPALILLGGSEGGAMITRDAPVWASRGYAVLALPYYSPMGWGPNGPTPAELPGLPSAFADIPVDRLQQARDWLAQQPEVDAARIGVMGTSKGAEFALLAAARMPWVRAVVAIVPTDVVWEGWGMGIAAGTRSGFSWQGKPLPFVPYLDFDKEFAGFATGAEVRIRRPQDKGRAAHPGRVPAARIPVEDIAAPVLVAGAHDDQIWDSGSMAQAIADRRAQAGRTTVSLVFKDAGHYLGGTGWAPTTQYNAGPMKSGGTPEATARAQAQTFEQTVAFLRQHLGPASPGSAP
jgi:dienelactone hydrolase